MTLIRATVIPGEVDKSWVKQPALGLHGDWRLLKASEMAKPTDGSSMPGSLVNPRQLPFLPVQLVQSRLICAKFAMNRQPCGFRGGLVIVLRHENPYCCPLRTFQAMHLTMLAILNTTHRKPCSVVQHEV